MGREEERKGERRRGWVRNKRRKERGKDRREDKHFCLKESELLTVCLPYFTLFKVNVEHG